MMGVLGPIAGASLVAVGGTSLAFGLDALSFFISALCVFLILRMGLKDTPKTESQVGGIHEGSFHARDDQAGNRRPARRLGCHRYRPLDLDHHPDFWHPEHHGSQPACRVHALPHQG